MGCMLALLFRVAGKWRHHLNCCCDNSPALARGECSGVSPVLAPEDQLIQIGLPPFHCLVGHVPGVQIPQACPVVRQSQKEGNGAAIELATIATHELAVGAQGEAKAPGCKPISRFAGRLKSGAMQDRWPERRARAGTTTPS